jgi:hypothetical protein
MRNLQIYLILIVLWLCQAGRCQSQPAVQVLQATYGAGSQQIDVTAKVQSLVKGGQMNFRVGNHLFGTDPAFGKIKTLSVLFSSDGIQYRTDIREGEPLSLSTVSPDQSSVASQAQDTQTEATVSPSGAPIATTTVPSGDLAPGTALWLVQRRSVTTKTGIIGILPGSKVTVTKDNGPTVTVTDGTYTFEVERTQLTTDSAVAEEAATVDYTSQVALSKAREESDRKLTGEKNKYWAKEQSTLDQRDKIRILESRYTALQQQESELQRQIGEARKSLTTIRGGHIPNPASSDLPSLEASLRNVRSAKDGVKRQIEEAQRSH